MNEKLKSIQKQIEQFIEYTETAVKKVPKPHTLQTEKQHAGFNGRLTALYQCAKLVNDAINSYIECPYCSADIYIQDKSKIPITGIRCTCGCVFDPNHPEQGYSVV